MPVNPFTVATAKIVIAGALAALIVASFFLERATGWRRRAFALAFALVLAASTLAYFNLGQLRYSGGVTNAWEQYHFFLGSKYLPEVRYDGLYDATAAAMADRYHVPKGIKVRDLRTFELRPAHASLESVEAARSRFAPERWQEFGSDVVVFFRKLGLPLERVICDHGNTGSPAWAAIARLFTARAGAGVATLSWLSLLDVALLVALSAAIARSFDLPTLCIAMSIGLLVPTPTTSSAAASSASTGCSPSALRPACSSSSGTGRRRPSSPTRSRASRSARCSRCRSAPATPSAGGGRGGRSGRSSPSSRGRRPRWSSSSRCRRRRWAAPRSGSTTASASTSTCSRSTTPSTTRSGRLSPARARGPERRPRLDAARGRRLAARGGDRRLRGLLRARARRSADAARLRHLAPRRRGLRLRHGAFFVYVVFVTNM